MEVSGESGDPHYYHDAEDPKSNLEELHKLLVKARAKEITYIMNGDLFRNKEKARETVARFKRIVGDGPVKMQYVISVGFPKTGVRNWRKLTAEHPKVREQNQILDNLHEVMSELGVDYQVMLHGRFTNPSSPGFQKYKGIFHLRTPSEQSAFKRFSYAKWLTAKELKAHYEKGRSVIRLGNEPLNIQHNGLIYSDTDWLLQRPIGSVYKDGMFGVTETGRK